MSIILHGFIDLHYSRVATHNGLEIVVRLGICFRGSSSVIILKTSRNNTKH